MPITATYFARVSSGCEVSSLVFVESSHWGTPFSIGITNADDVQIHSILSTRHDDQEVINDILRVNFPEMYNNQNGPYTCIPKNEFPNGFWSYNVLKTSRKLMDMAYIFHANFVKGNDNKINKMKEFKVWFLWDSLLVQIQKVQKWKIGLSGCFFLWRSNSQSFWGLGYVDRINWSQKLQMRKFLSNLVGKVSFVS